MTSHLYGLHERLRTPALRKELEAEGLEKLARWKGTLKADEVGPALAAHLAQVFGELGRALRESDRRAWHQAVRDLEQALSAAGEPLSSLPSHLPELPLQQLLEILRPEHNVVGAGTTVRPDLPLGVSALLTGSTRTPSLVSQLEKDLQSADRADWLVSFIKWSGIRPLRDVLRRFTQKPAEGGGPRLRVGTTSYLGATDAKAVRFPAELDNTEVGAGRSALPDVISVDQGTEFTSKSLDHWAYWNRVRLDFSRPGKPTDNAFAEAFNSVLRRECLSQHYFIDEDDAQRVLDRWRADYNNFRPHRSLDRSTPADFATGALQTPGPRELEKSHFI